MTDFRSLDMNGMRGHGYTVRQLAGRPIVLLSSPAREVLTIDADGRVAVRSGNLVNAWPWRLPLTVAQRDALSALGVPITEEVAR